MLSIKVAPRRPVMPREVTMEVMISFPENINVDGTNSSVAVSPVAREIAN